MIIPKLLLFLNFGGGEIIIILLIILLVLGPDKIPEFARKARDVMRYVRKATDDIKTEINKETDAIQKPIKSAYENVSAFSKNANDAMKATLDEIENDEKREVNKDLKKEKVSLDDIDKEIKAEEIRKETEKMKNEMDGSIYQKRNHDDETTNQ